MNVDDLKKLKEQLESKQTYVAINGLFDKKEIMNATDAKPLYEYVSQERTDEFVSECESLIENTVIQLSEKGIPFDMIEISSEIGFLCKADFIEKIKRNFDEICEDDELWTHILDELESQISLEYTPLRFSINAVATGTEDMDIDDYESETGVNFDDIRKHTVSGIVNFKKFISKMKNLGYNIELLNYGDCSNIFDYIQCFKENADDTIISVVANLGREKNLHDGTGYRSK